MRGNAGPTLGLPARCRRYRHEASVGAGDPARHARSEVPDPGPSAPPGPRLAGATPAKRSRPRHDLRSGPGPARQMTDVSRGPRPHLAPDAPKPIAGTPRLA